MNGTAPKIEVITPLSRAMELTKRILFQPFNLEKWLIIGFAAFLAGWFNSGGAGVGPWNFRSFDLGHPQPIFTHRNFHIHHHAGPFSIIIFVTIAICVLVFVFLWLWLTSRGRFIFIDCIVRDRAAILAPWREFRREGNRFFLFVLVLTLGILVVLAALAAVTIVPMIFWGAHRHSSVWAITAIAVMIFVWVALSILVNLVICFVPPVMYARRCSPTEAARAVLGLMFDYPAPFILFILLTTALWIAWIVVGCIVTCATCCIASLPYAGTVIVLPVPVVFRAFSLLFLQQFGNDFDVWRTLTAPPVQAIEAPSPAPAPPPPSTPSSSEHAPM